MIAPVIKKGYEEVFEMKKSSFVALILGVISGLFFCTGNVHGYDSGLERIQTGNHRRMCRNCICFDYCVCMEKNGA